MSFTVCGKIEKIDKEMRQVFCETMIAMAEKNPDIVLLDCDLMGAMDTVPFRERFPERTFDCGIQEADMMGIAAGLSAGGRIPFAHTFGVFASRRSFDQVFMSCAYAGQNVKIVGSDPGITAELNGGTHMAFEDLGMMRGLPEMTVVEPTDCTMLADLLPKIAAMRGCVYLRLVRRLCENVYEPGSSFTVGKANVLREGTDAVIFSMGYCTAQSLIAADLLAAQGISARVVDVFTLKPLDREEIVRSAALTGAVVTAENHYINNGLGSAVAEVLSEECPTPLVRIGIQDVFGEVGKRDWLASRFGINAPAIADDVKKAIAKKRV